MSTHTQTAPPAAPTVQVWRSEDDTHWTVQVDTTADTGPVVVDVNDGRVFHGDPESFDAVAAAEQALAELDPDEGTWPTGEQLEAIVAAVRGDRG